MYTHCTSTCMHILGYVTTNGQQVNKRSFRKESGYVMQSDALFPLLTVRETIQYAAKLRVSADKSNAEKLELADAIIRLLRLENVADTIVGDDDNRGLSGGEKRRVSIAVDIVHFPSIIFLDEPTSGLDSTTALSVVDSLKALAETLNCTVVMTIHQPSARLFALLDRVLFLAAGRTTFAGTTSELDAYTKEMYAATSLGTYGAHCTAVLTWMCCYPPPFPTPIQKRAPVYNDHQFIIAYLNCTR